MALSDLECLTHSGSILPKVLRVDLNPHRPRSREHRELQSYPTGPCANSLIPGLRQKAWAYHSCWLDLVFVGRAKSLKHGRQDPEKVQASLGYCTRPD